MSLFDAKSLVGTATSALGGLFTQYTGVTLTPAGTAPVQATLPANRTGTPAQDPIAGAGSNGVSATGGKTSGGLFGGSTVSPILLVVGSIVAVAAIVMIARR